MRGGLERCEVTEMLASLDSAVVREEERRGETVRRGDTAVWPGSLTAGIVPAEFRQLTGCLFYHQ